jgi:WD40-like Beta Propeller Repeat
MRFRAVAVLALIGGLAFACTADFDAPFAGGKQNDAIGDTDAGRDAAKVDGEADAGPRCDPSKPFGPVVLFPSSGADNDASGRLSSDERTITFVSDRGTSPRRFRVWSATRPSVDAPFGPPVLTADTTASSLFDPALTSDGLTGFFQVTDSVSSTLSRVQVGTRAKKTDVFRTFAAVPGLGGTADDRDPFLAESGSILFARQARDAGAKSDLYAAAPVPMGFAAPSELTTLNTPASERDPVLSSDGLEVFFSSDRGQTGIFRIYAATRSSPSGDFGPATKVLELGGTTSYEAPTWLSADRCVLYLASDNPGITRILSTTRGR